jgi:hypothetical protein
LLGSESRVRMSFPHPLRMKQTRMGHEYGPGRLHKRRTAMAEGVYQRQAPAAEQRTERPWAAMMVVLVVAAFVAGCRTGRGWGRLTGY